MVCVGTNNDLITNILGRFLEPFHWEGLIHILSSTVAQATPDTQMHLRWNLAAGLHKKAKCSAACVLRKAFCFTGIQVFNNQLLPCVGIALNSACKLRLAQKAADGLASGFNPWVWQLKMCLVSCYPFSFAHFVLCRSWEFLEIPLPAPAKVSRDDHVEPFQTKWQKLMLRYSPSEAATSILCCVIGNDAPFHTNQSL